MNGPDTKLRAEPGELAQEAYELWMGLFRLAHGDEAADGLEAAILASAWGN